MATRPLRRAHLLARFALLSVVALGGCGILPFEVGQDIPEQRVPGSVNPLVGLLPDFLQTPVPIAVDLKSETAKRNTGPATSVVLKSLTLSITPHERPATSFDFLDSVHVFVEAQPARGLPRRELAYLDPAPRGQTTVTFVIVPGVELLPYVQSDESDPDARARMTAEARGTQPRTDLTYDGHLVLEIKI